MSFSVHESVVASAGSYLFRMGPEVGVSGTFRYRPKIGGMVRVVGVGGYVERSHNEWIVWVVAVRYSVSMGLGISVLCVLFHLGRGLRAIVVHYRCVSILARNSSMPRVLVCCDRVGR